MDLSRPPPNTRIGRETQPHRPGRGHAPQQLAITIYPQRARSESRMAPLATLIAHSRIVNHLRIGQTWSAPRTSVSRPSSATPWRISNPSSSCRFVRYGHPRAEGIHHAGHHSPGHHLHDGALAFRASASETLSGTEPQGKGFGGRGRLNRHTEQKPRGSCFGAYDWNPRRESGSGAAGLALPLPIFRREEFP